MPAFRSKANRSSEAGFVFRSELPATSRRAMIPFFRHALKIKKSLDTLVDGEAPDLLHYALTADLRDRRFTVSSAWRDEDAFRAWCGTTVHTDAMSDLGPVQNATFETETLDPI